MKEKEVIVLYIYICMYIYERVFVCVFSEALQAVTDRDHSALFRSSYAHISNYRSLSLFNAHVGKNSLAKCRSGMEVSTEEVGLRILNTLAQAVHVSALQE